MTPVIYFLVGTILVAGVAAVKQRSREVTLKGLAIAVTSAFLIFDEIMDSRGVPITDGGRELGNLISIAAAIWVLYLFRADFGRGLMQLREEYKSNNPSK